ncbi:MAG TPA: APC family permease [Gemmatimonadaceae bacterium]|nr:APC family permease [Gemmatimonadaceae bacterium]
MKDTAVVTEAGLLRTLGVRQMATNVVNGIVGSGIFVLPAAVAAILGPAAIIAYLVCATAVALIALCFAESGSRVSLTGGTYAYAEIAFGPYVGVLVGATLFVSQVVASAAVATIFVGSLGALMPALSGLAGRAILLIAVYLALAVVNIRGVQVGARLINVVTVAKIAPLVILIVVGAFLITPANLAWPHWPSIGQVGAASLALFFAFTGLEGVLTPSGEVRHPARTIPRAILVGVVITTALYIGVQLVSQGILGPELATDSTAPVAAAAGSAMGRWGRILVLLGASISTFGFMTGDMLATPRVLFAFARDRLLPPQVGAVNPRFHTPYVAIAIYCVVCCMLALSGTFRALEILGSVGSLVIYLSCALATLELRRRNVRSDGPPFCIPGGPTVPILAVLVALWLLAQAGRAELTSFAGVLIVASVLYWLRRRRMAPEVLAEESVDS